jgi:plasmid maintenance system antidote protein VapI
MNRLKVEISDQFGSQRKFAQAVQIHETTISNIVVGIFEPSEEQREKIVKVLGLSWDKLIKEI